MVFYRFLRLSCIDKCAVCVVMLIPRSYPRDSNLIVWISGLLKLPLVMLISNSRLRTTAL